RLLDLASATAAAVTLHDPLQVSGRGDDARRPRGSDEGWCSEAGRRATRALRASGEPLRRRLHRRRADEAGDEAVRRTLVELEWLAYLLHYTILHHYHGVAERHRLDLRPEEGRVGLQLRRSRWRDLVV